MKRALHLVGYLVDLAADVYLVGLLLYGHTQKRS
jgi:hypothetical protein